MYFLCLDQTHLIFRYCLPHLLYREPIVMEQTSSKRNALKESFQSLMMQWAATWSGFSLAFIFLVSVRMSHGDKNEACS